MNIHETDSVDGSTTGRQLAILLSHIGCIAISVIIVILFQMLVLKLAKMDMFLNWYMNKKIYIPITLLVCGLLWIKIFVTQKRGWCLIKGNHARPSINPLSPEKLQGGGTRFIIYQTGFSLNFLWEILQGKELEIDKEIAIECGETTITIKKISLQVILVVTYRILPNGLSKYLQNLVTEASGQPQVLEQIKASANQRLEVACCALQNADTELIRAKQTELIDTILPNLQEEGAELGIEILTVRFKKCDYSAETQRELNKLIEAEAIRDIAQSIQPGHEEAYKIAAVMAGKPGATSATKTVYSLEMDDNTATAIQLAGPAAAAATLALLSKKQKPTN